MHGKKTKHLLCKCCTAVDFREKVAEEQDKKDMQQAYRIYEDDILDRIAGELLDEYYYGNR